MNVDNSLKILIFFQTLLERILIFSILRKHLRIHYLDNSCLDESENVMLMDTYAFSLRDEIDTSSNIEEDV